MPTVHVPLPLRSLTNQQAKVEVAGETVRELVDSLERRYPGIRDRLCSRDGHLRPGFAVAIGSRISSDRGLLEQVPANAEVHFLPAVAGG